MVNIYLDIDLNSSVSKKIQFFGKLSFLTLREETLFVYQYALFRFIFKACERTL